VQWQQQDLFNAMGSMYAAVLYIGVQNAGSVQPVVVVVLFNAGAVLYIVESGIVIIVVIN
jgi:hypothetical protein